MAIAMSDITSIVIGRVGENDAVGIDFDYADWIAEFGEGTLTLNFMRPTEDIPYPVTVTFEDGIVTWLVSSIDTAISGVGEAQFTYSVDDVIKKSRIFSAIILKSIGMSGQVPDPYDTWLAEMQEIAQTTIGYADAARQTLGECEAVKTELENSFLHFADADNDGNIVITKGEAEL